MKAVTNVIYFLSILAILYGGFTYLSNMPTSFESSNDNTISGSFNNLVGGVGALYENSRRKDKQEESIIFLVIGGIGCAVGFIVQQSNKKEG